jgi:transposase
MGRPRKYPVEVRERAVRLARESERGIVPVARDLGLNPGTLRK